MLSDKELILKIREEINTKFCVVDEHKEECKKIKHILIIDDDDISNFATRKTLECYDLVEKVTVFDNPMEALDYLKTCKSQPDIILLDIKMPLMNGFQFIEEFKNIDSNSIIFILSSSVYSKDKDKAKDCGINYMAKPLKYNIFNKYLD